MFNDVLVVIKGGGDLATGVTFRLYRAGFPLIVTEIAQPTVIRRTVSFAEAVYEGEVTVEGVVARRVEGAADALRMARERRLPVIVDPEASIVSKVNPTVVVDAIMAKRNVSTKLSDAPIVIALGPGFRAGVDAHAVIETNRGHYLGRVILDGEAEPNTGVPGSIGGYGVERVVRAPAEGVIKTIQAIGDQVKQGETLGWVNGKEVKASIMGVLRGMIKEGLRVSKGMKIGDIDPRAAREHCFTISDKALAIGGGVLEAILFFLNRLKSER